MPKSINLLFLRRIIKPQKKLLILAEKEKCIYVQIEKKIQILYLTNKSVRRNAINFRPLQNKIY